MPQNPMEITNHPRTFETNRHVYAVLSRRSGGVSIGVNLNPDKICNFDCIYCQVDRTVPPLVRNVDLDLLNRELETILTRVKDGNLLREPQFLEVPSSSRRVVDIAFAGDGEPTAYPRFGEVLEHVVSLKRRLGLEEIKIVVLTNCTLLHRPAVQQALQVLDGDGGEIWAKLDAGTEAYYEEICVPGGAKFRQILENILEVARIRPIVVQSLFLRLNGFPPSAEEVTAFCARLNEVKAGGGKIRLVQIYTIARRPAQPTVAALTNDEVDSIAATVEESTGLLVKAYYGPPDG